jgi:hypothetical protein
VALGLRLIALFQGFGGILFVFATPLALRDGLPQSLARALALAALLAAGPLGLMSAVLLTRLRESGRRAALGFVAAVVVFALANGGTPELTLAGVLKLGVNLVIVLVLVSERARDLCREAPGPSGGEAPPTDDPKAPGLQD